MQPGGACPCWAQRVARYDTALWSKGADVSAPIGRRRWLGALLPTVADTVTRAVAPSFELEAQRRPPGACPEPLFLKRCTRCGDCVKACPHDAVHVFSEQAGALAGTPVMVPEQRACHMCDGFPCAAACEEGALSSPASALWPLGKVRIEAGRCIAFAGPECGACVGVCPGGLVSIRLERWRPELDPETCVGCGLCIEACPTTPPAIEMLPLDPANQGQA